MNKKFKVMQGICLALLLVLIGVVVYYFVKLIDSDTNGGMNETGLGIILLLFLGGFLILYTLVCGYFYIRLLHGKQVYYFHRINAKFTGLVSLTILLSIIIFRRAILIFYFGPLVLPLFFIFITSFNYNKNYSKELNR